MFLFYVYNNKMDGILLVQPKHKYKIQVYWMVGGETDQTLSVSLFNHNS